MKCPECGNWADGGQIERSFVNKTARIGIVKIVCYATF